MLRETQALLAVGGATALLAPVTLGARLHGAATCAWLEADAARSALAVLGVTDRPLAIDRIGGGRSNAVYRLRFARRTLVLKRALATGTVLAFAVRWVGPQPFARDVSAAGRIAREARALTTLAAAGVRVPAVIAARADAELLLLDHVAGEPLPATLGRTGADTRIAAYGRAIRAAHAAGITLGDGHPGNALVGKDGAVTLIDLEFAEHAADVHDVAARRAFDLAYAAAYFTAAERPIFLAAAGAGADVARAAARLDELAPLFAYERRRQRRAA